MSNRYSLLPSETKAPNYGMLLLVLCLLIVFAPVATRTSSVYGVEALFNLVLLAGVYSAASRGGRKWPFVALATLTLATRWSGFLGWLRAGAGLRDDHCGLDRTSNPDCRERVVSSTRGHDQHDLGRHRGVTPGGHRIRVSLRDPRDLPARVFFGNPWRCHNLQELGNAPMYFSLAGLTTMGYRDIVPVSGLAGPMAVFEGAFGMLYLAVMVAGLVGLHIAIGIKGEGNER